MKKKLLALLRFTWRSIAAVVVMVVILIAFIAGWLLGEDSGDDEPANDATVAAANDADGSPQMYTCSMHPQVRLPDPNAKCPICFMDLIPVPKDDDGGDRGERELTMTPTAMKLANIQTTPVVRMFPQRTVRLFGRLDYDQTRIATISAYFPGRLERLFVDYTGVRVKEGDHLAEIYSPELIAAQEELRQARASLDAISGGSEIVRSSTEATYKATKEKLRLWGLTDEQVREIENSDALLERLTIYSPIGGIVTHKRATEGMYVQTGEQIYQVADLDRLWLNLEAYESQLPWLRYGQQVEFTVESMPGQTFAGTIAFIDPTVDPMTRTIPVRVNVDNTQGLLKPGMYARTVVKTKIASYGQIISDDLAGKWISPMHPEIIKDGPGQCDICGMDLVPVEELGYRTVDATLEPPLVIPATAPLITGERAVVYVKLEKGDKPSFEGRVVTLGPEAGGYFIVLDGLREGEYVVTNGAFKIDSALQIAARPSMMSAEESSGSAASTDAQRLTVPDTFVYGLKPLYAAYFAMSESLAADDLAAFTQAAGDLERSLALVDVTGVVGEPLGWWRRIERTLTESAQAGQSMRDIEQARTSFETLSEALVNLQNRFGHYGARSHYLMHCPMAFDNAGADWLSRVDEINNPYFGASMLRCGSVEATFPPLQPGDGGQGQ
ncbi:MAG: efflux RND transporter periplasmic adaptor subunit [Phycisphaerales bacterium]